MKLFYLSVIGIFLLCAWTPIHANENCEQTFRQLEAQYEADKQAAHQKFEQVFFKTNNWFREARRHAPSVRAIYSMQRKQEEALAVLDQAFAQEKGRIEAQYQQKLYHWEQDCKKPLASVQAPLAEAESAPQSRQLSDHESSAETMPLNLPEDEIGRPSKRKRRKAAKAAYEARTNALLAEAQRHLNTRYRYGGNSPSQGFDCSGYVKYIYQKQDITLPRVSKDQAKEGKKIKRKDAAPGDLIYFGRRKGKITHVGIVTSKPGRPLEMIHASSTKGVEIAPIEGVKYWERRIQGFRRILE